MKKERWDLHVLKQNNTRVIVSKYFMAQSLWKKKVGVYPAPSLPPPPEKSIHKKYFTMTRYKTLLRSYIFLSQNGRNYFVIRTLINLVQPNVGELVLSAFFLGIRGFHVMISPCFSMAKRFECILLRFKNFLMHG